MDSYGGLHFFHRFIDKSGLNQVVDLVLGKRAPQAEYSYTEVFTSFTATCLAGGTYTEDMNILRSKNHCETDYQYCSSDTFKYVNYQLVDSMQSGNATPKTNLAEVLKAGFEAMEKAGLSYEIFRADGACYSEEAIRLILFYCQHYIIRSRRSQVRQDLIKPEECSLVDIRGELYRIYEHTDTFAGRPCRRIYYQKINQEKDLFSEITFDEIITTLTEDQYSTIELIKMYFDRGR